MGSSRGILAAVVLVVLSLQSFHGYAQTWDEIFSQKKTQQKYLMQQIAALQIYIGYAKKGYDIVGGGVNAVKDITSGEFNLHRNFFASLALVNPSVKNSSAVAEIVNGQLGIISALKNWKASGMNTDDWIYVSLVKANLLAQCASELEELFLVVTSGKLEMKDDERLMRLEALRLSMQEKYDFALSFSLDLKRLIEQRIRELKSTSEVRRFYGIE